MFTARSIQRGVTSLRGQKSNAIFLKNFRPCAINNTSVVITRPTTNCIAARCFSTESRDIDEVSEKVKYRDLDVLAQVEHQVRSESRSEDRERKQARASEKRIRTLAKVVPEHLLSCRGCGAHFQYEDESISGYVPRHHLQAFLERTKLQMDASEQDLRIRSGGGKGQGTAVAALHASLKSALVEAHDESKARQGKGAFKLDRLVEMGLDAQMKPLPRVPEYDEQGNRVHIEEPEEKPEVFNQHAADRARREKEIRLKQLMADGDADPEEVNRLMRERHRPDRDSKSVPENQVLDKREVNMLEKAAKMAAKPLRCMRCHQLAHNAVAQGAVAAVRAEDFVELLHNEFKSKNAGSAVIIKIVDLFDFHGSFIPNFKSIAGGRNPIILAVNKLDLLPSGIGFNALHAWVKREADKYNLNLHSICLFSARTGQGVEDLMSRALTLARGRNNDGAPRNRNIYIVGTTNVGKSTLVNQLMKKHTIGTGMLNDTAGGHFDKARVVLDSHPLDDDTQSKTEDVQAQEETKQHPLLRGDDADLVDSNKIVSEIDVKGISPAALQAVIPTKYLIKHHQQLLLQHATATTSPIPGTTLGITSYPILEKKRGGKNLKLKDTPGVLNAHQLSSYLHYDELKAVLPTRRIQPHSYRVKTGQSLLFGGLARVDMIAGRPFNIAAFTAPKVSVQITSTHKVTREYLEEHMGIMLMPPYDPKARADALNIYDTVAVSPEEAVALQRMQALSKDEYETSMQRAQQRMGHDAHARLHPEEHKKAIALSLEAPRTGRDRAATLRVQGSSVTSDVLSKMVPLERAIDTEYPARSFIDAQGRIVYQLQGAGWNQSSHDIVIAGLGWISVTGSGPITLRVSIAGEKFAFDDEALAAAAHAAANVSGDIGNVNSALPPAVRRAYARTACRNPLLPWVANTVEKFVGTPAALKHQLSSQLEARRDELRKEKEGARAARRAVEQAAWEEEHGTVDDDIVNAVLNLEYPNPESAAKNRHAKPRTLERVEVDHEAAFDVFVTPTPQPPRALRRTAEEAAWAEVQKAKEARMASVVENDVTAMSMHEQDLADLDVAAAREAGRLAGRDELVKDWSDVDFSDDANLERAYSDDEFDETLAAAAFHTHTDDAAVADRGYMRERREDENEFDDVYSSGEVDYDELLASDSEDSSLEAELEGDDNWRAIMAFQKQQGAQGGIEVVRTGRMKEAAPAKPAKKAGKAIRAPVDDDNDDAIPMVDPLQKYEKVKKNGKYSKYDTVIHKEELERAAASRPLRMPSKRGESLIRQQGSLLAIADDVPSLEEMDAVRSSHKPRTVRGMRDEPDLDDDMISADDFAALEEAAGEFDGEDSDGDGMVRRRAKGSNPFAAQHRPHGTSAPQYTATGTRNDGYESFYTQTEKEARGVSTGPGGKKETGGRRARKALGLQGEDRYVEASKIEKQASYVNQMKAQGKKAVNKK